MNAWGLNSAAATAWMDREAERPWLSGLLLVGLGVVALHPLTVTWDTLPNYSYGWLIPLVALYLFWERWSQRPTRGGAVARPGTLFFLAACAAPFLALRLVAETDPTWRPGLWVMMAFYVVIVFAWLALYGGLPWVKHFAFPVGFLFLCLPWPFGLELSIVLHLMGLNVWLVHNSLTLLGIPSTVTGHVINLANCQLGVEEACSGILSLQASLMMGCLLGEIYQLTVGRRIGLAFLAMLLAMVGNYGRTLFLSLMAVNGGANAVLAWHDTAGFSILFFTGVSSWLLCLWLNGGRPAIVAPVPTNASLAPSPGQLPLARGAFCLAAVAFAVAAIVELGIQGWFGWRETQVVHHPLWSAVLPTGNRPMPMTPEVSNSLQFDAYCGGQWRDANGLDWTAMWFDFKPKSGTEVVLNWHNPNNCLPSVGWHEDARYPSFATTVNGVNFDVQTTLFSSGQNQIYVFWLLYPTSGTLPSGINRAGKPSLSSRITDHLRDIWHGYRGVGMETLEVALAGPSTYEEARKSYVAQLQKMVTSVPPSDTKTALTLAP